MIINIHWGEFCGQAERAEIDLLSADKEKKENRPLYKYLMLLRGYLPFTLFKDILSGQWVTNPIMEPSISSQVVFYTKKFIDDFEVSHR
jgi:hypothetical protein